MKQTTISGCLLVYCRLAVCLSAIPLLSGCVIPYPHTTLRSKEVTGTVLDARTRAPIKGARVVQSEHSINGAKPKTRATTTNASGRFKLPTSHNFHLAIGSGGERFEDLPPGHVYEEVTIFSPGYLSYQMKGYGDVKILLQPVHSLEVAGRVLDSRTMAPVVGRGSISLTSTLWSALLTQLVISAGRPLRSSTTSTGRGRRHHSRLKTGWWRTRKVMIRPSGTAAIKQMFATAIS